MSEYAKNIQTIEDMWKKRIELRDGEGAMTELLPCPFCGGEAEMLTAESMHGGNLYGVMCDCCACRTDVFDTEAEAIAAWNTRAERTCFADEVTHRDCKYSINRGWRERTCQRFWTGAEMICSACAHQLNSKTANYCPSCGAKVVGE